MSYTPTPRQPYYPYITEADRPDCFYRHMDCLWHVALHRRGLTRRHWTWQFGATATYQHNAMDSRRPTGFPAMAGRRVADVIVGASTSTPSPDAIIFGPLRSGCPRLERVSGADTLQSTAGAYLKSRISPSGDRPHTRCRSVWPGSGLKIHLIRASAGLPRHCPATSHPDKLDKRRPLLSTRHGLG